MDSEAFGTEGNMKDAYNSVEKANSSSSCLSRFLVVCSPCAYVCRCSGSSEKSSDKHTSEDGMFYCSLCEVEVFKYSKHCRVCDKCVNHFDHHCRWLNNCIEKTIGNFFSLMVAAMLLFILQWSTGLLVLVCCFVERKQFSKEISLKLGSSFSMAPFVIVVVSIPPSPVVLYYDITILL